MPDIKIVGQTYSITAACNTGQSLSWTDYQPTGHPRWSSASPSQPEIIQEVMQYSPPPGSSLRTETIVAPFFNFALYLFFIETSGSPAQFNMLSSHQFLIEGTEPEPSRQFDNLGLAIKLLV